jgi:hypothetical protein
MMNTPLEFFRCRRCRMYHVAGFVFDEKIHDAKCKPQWVWGDVSKLPAAASVIDEPTENQNARHSNRP